VTSDSSSENVGQSSVRIAKILPKISARQLFAYRQCYLGISLENPLFEGQPLRSLLWWAAEQFDKCLVILGDHLSRFNERILTGCGLDEAAKRAEKLGDSFITKNKTLFDELPSGKVRLTRWKEHLHSQQYEESRVVVQRLFASDDGFKASVEKDAFSFVKRLKRRNQHLAVETEQATALCCEYLLEEIAVFSALSQQGWHVELYPGSELRVLVEVAGGKYKTVPKGLKDRISVELEITDNGLGQS